MLVLGEISVYPRANKDEARMYGDCNLCFLLRKKTWREKMEALDGCHAPAVHRWAHARVATRKQAVSHLTVRPCMKQKGKRCCTAGGSSVRILRFCCTPRVSERGEKVAAGGHHEPYRLHIFFYKVFFIQEKPCGRGSGIDGHGALHPTAVDQGDRCAGSPGGSIARSKKETMYNCRHPLIFYYCI